MQLAILHYHLNRGGVTQVIRNQLRALSAAEYGSIERVTILYGGRSDAWPEEIPWPGRPLDLRLVPVEALEYDGLSAADCPSAAALAEQIKEALAKISMRPAETLLHVHNHALGKNVFLPGALARLAGDGFRLLLQIHDFAEDFRPGNYRHLAECLHADSAAALAAELYPQGYQIHYAVLNGRDCGMLQGLFPDPRQVHLLPNPVEGPGRLPDRGVSRRKLARLCDVPESVPLVVYPVRGIRRKNVGEMLLWSTILRERAVFAVTLRPLNPAESIGFHRWSSLAAELGLACRFHTGEATGLGLIDNLAGSDALITTSVAEGFGMVFLEASLCGRPLLGRDLPEITADFKQQGVRFPWLAAGLRIPRGVLEPAVVCDRLATEYLQVRRAYGLCDNAADALEARQHLEMEEPDFAVLTPDMQAEVIRRATHEAPVRDAIEAANERLFYIPNRQATQVAETLAQNAAVIEERFGLASSGRRLGELYNRIMASPIGPVSRLAGGDAILSAFLDLRRLHPVRLEA